ncbi:hypothetical protein RJ639_038074 [Escallonia herrerae]|uniref:Uncharacterized protein n=1 Tax=Escallonia herrerae TaxID=1293975 RepID=A0AA89B5L1_9ASTE|nr:hypothetical protein RJ639_038074 [Escallonia herrerae]
MGILPVLLPSTYQAREKAFVKSTDLGFKNKYSVPLPIIPPPLEQGRKWTARPAATNSSSPHPVAVGGVDEYEDNSDEVYDSNDELLSNDDDSDASKKSLGTRKKRFYYTINHCNPPPVIPPPLEQGRKWTARPAATNSSSPYPVAVGLVDEYEDNSEVYDSDDELLSNDDDSDASKRSLGMGKMRFKAFFEKLETLNVEQVNEPEMFHCPACQGGPGAIAWYHGLMPLVTHAKNKGIKKGESAVRTRRTAR